MLLHQRALHLLRAVRKGQLLRAPGDRRPHQGTRLLRVPLMATRELLGGPPKVVALRASTMPPQAVDWSAFYNQLHGFVASRVRPASDVDDLVQVILERAMSKAAETEVGNAAGWLFGIARNAIADHYRGQARTLVAAADALEAVDGALGVSEEERAAVLACMEPLLNTLPEEVAQLLRWADMQGRPMQTIADELGISLTAAKSRVQRARKDFVKTTRDCCAITVDARGRVTDLTPHDAPRATECAGCVTDLESKNRKRHDC
jgi:RNA polymerase sigma-70 factor (ECF subfamily)